MNNINIKKLEIVRTITRIVTITASLGIIPLTIFAPLSSRQVIEDYGFYGSIYTVYDYNIYLALAFVLPVLALIITNGNLKRYYKRCYIEVNSPIRTQNIETIKVIQGKQQIQQIGRIDIKFCIVCGQPNNAKGNYCNYCGIDL